MLNLNNSLSVYWHGHASLEIAYCEKRIFIDPFKVKVGRANIILVTHFHPNHFSKDDISKLKLDDTIIITPVNCPYEFQGSLILMKPGSSVTVHDILISALPAYNLGGKPYHPKSNNWVGYILDINGTRIYHSGDTDYIPEMNKIRNIDAAFLPVSGRSVMNPKKAALAANNFRPKIAVPIHWDSNEGSMQDAAIFKKLFKGNTVLIKPVV